MRTYIQYSGTVLSYTSFVIVVYINETRCQATGLKCSDHMT